MKKLTLIVARKALHLSLAVIIGLMLQHYGPIVWHMMSIFGNVEALVEVLRGLRVVGLALVFVLLFIQVLTPLIPGHALVMASGYIYGAPMTILIVSVSTILASEMAFWLARRYGRPVVRRLASQPAVKAFDTGSGKRGAVLCFFAFVLPFFPSDLMCYLAGLGRVSARDFLLANVAGRLLSTTAITLIGSFGFNPPLAFWLAVAVGLVLFYFAWGVYTGSFAAARRYVQQTVRALRHSGLRLCTDQTYRDELVGAICRASVKAILQSYIKIFSLRCKVSGRWPLPAGPKIIVANHSNATDPFYLPFILPDNLHFLMQANLFKPEVIGTLLRRAAQVKVEHDDGRSAFRDASEWLERGETVVIYPEARLNPDGKTLRSKTGAVRLSLKTGVPIIPLGIYVERDDLVELTLGKGPYHHNGRWQIAGTCFLHFGAPWLPDQAADHIATPAHALTDRLMGMVYALVAESQNLVRTHASTLTDPTAQEESRTAGPGIGHYEHLGS